MIEGAPQVLDESALGRAITRLAHEVAERHPGLEGVVLAGVPTRGVPIAQRLVRALTELGQAPPPIAAMELSDYRDDRPRPPVPVSPVLRSLDDGRPIPVDGAIIVVVDDVFYTGRTLRAALDALAHLGRPACVELLVLVDRGHRELPVRATYVGKNIPTSAAQRVAVRLEEVDGLDGAWLVAAGDGP
jgi:pyrimidine operon attenuation protein/uracil phosphoribosyltransferase